MAGYNPAQAVPLKVEAYLGPVFGWVNVTSRHRGRVGIQVARTDRGQTTETAQADLALDNDDGAFTEDNPMSPYYPYVGRGMKVRVSVTGVAGLGVDSVRFAGRAETLQPDYPSPNISTMQIRAIGALGDIGQDDEVLASALRRSMGGPSLTDYVPLAFWPMEDPSGSTQFASAVTGIRAMVPTGPVSFGADATLAGATALALFQAGTSVSTPPLTYTSTGQWTVQLLVKVATKPTVTTVFAEIFGNPGATFMKVSLSIIPGTPDLLSANAYDSSGVLLFTAQTTILDSQFYDRWQGISVSASRPGGSISLSLVAGDLTGNDISTFGTAGTVPTLSWVRLNSYAQDIAFGMLRVVVDANFTIGTDDYTTFDAMAGWAGETTTDRFVRINTEERQPFDTPPASAYTMGPQPAGSKLDILREIELTDNGIISDTGTDGGLAMRPLSDMVNKAAVLAITTDALYRDFQPVWDTSQTRNDWTSSRTGGSSARVEDPDHIARTGVRRKDSAQVNTETDAMLIGDAGFRLGRSTVAGPRWPSLPLNLRNPRTAAYAQQVVAVKPGDRMTVAENCLPATYPPGGLDGVVLGWQEVLDADMWMWVPLCEPYAPYRAAVIEGAGDPTQPPWRLEAGASALELAATATATSLTVSTSEEPYLTTSAAFPADFPLDVAVAGEQIRVPSTLTSALVDAFGRTSSPGWGTPDIGPSSYTNGGGAATDHTVSGGTGRMSISAKNVSFSALVTAAYSTWDVYGTVTFPAVPTGASAEAGVQARRVDGSNFVDLRIFLLTSNVAQIIVRQVVAGVETTGAFTTISGVTTTSAIRWRLQAIGSTLRAKAWLASGSEPQPWLDAITTTMTSAGGLLLYTQVPNTLTNALPLLVQWDNVEVVNPQVLTVTRAVNGISKAQAAGATVHGWNLPGIALA